MNITDWDIETALTRFDRELLLKHRGRFHSIFDYIKYDGSRYFISPLNRMLTRPGESVNLSNIFLIRNVETGVDDIIRINWTGYKADTKPWFKMFCFADDETMSREDISSFVVKQQPFIATGRMIQKEMTVRATGEKRIVSFKNIIIAGNDDELIKKMEGKNEG